MHDFFCLYCLYAFWVRCNRFNSVLYRLSFIMVFTDVAAITSHVLLLLIALKDWDLVVCTVYNVYITSQRPNSLFFDLMASLRHSPLNIKLINLQIIWSVFLHQLFYVKSKTMDHSMHWWNKYVINEIICGIKLYPIPINRSASQHFFFFHQIETKTKLASKKGDMFIQIQ